MAKHCNYEQAWVGKCGAVGHCDKHHDLKCCVCGEPATHNCAETMGPLVCGCELCDECEHEIQEDGTNGYCLKHCKKTDQKFTPWYARNADE